MIEDLKPILSDKTFWAVAAISLIAVPFILKTLRFFFRIIFFVIAFLTVLWLGYLVLADKGMIG